MQAGLAHLVLGLALVSLACLPAAVQASEACAAATPPDAPFGCLEVIPLGDSAEVTFDGRSLGLSPLDIPEIEPGEHTLGLARAGAYPWYGKLTIEPGQVQRIDPPLAPQ